MRSIEDIGLDMSDERAAILDVARSYIGVKWRHQGRTREHGIDCVGLPLLVGTELNHMDHLLPANYPRRPNQTFIPIFKNYLELVTVSQEQWGDILVFAASGHPCHCGILAFRNGVMTVVHAHAAERMVFEETLESTERYIGKPVYTFKFKGLE